MKPLILAAGGLFLVLFGLWLYCAARISRGD